MRSIALVLATCLMMALSAASAQELPTVRFNTDVLFVDERDFSFFDLQILISDDPGGFAQVDYVQVEGDGTATIGEDFEDYRSFAQWFGGDALPQTALGSLFDDFDTEGIESFVMELDWDSVQGVRIGSPSRCVIYILDNETTDVDANFDLERDYAIGEDLIPWTWWIDDRPLELDVVTNATEASLIRINTPTGIDTLRATQSGIFVYPAPEGLDPERDLSQSFTILSGTLARESIGKSVRVRWLSSARTGGGTCLAVFSNTLFQDLTARGETLPEPAPDPARRVDENFVTVLQRYRDEVLSQSPQGRAYTAIYDNLSDDMIEVMLDRPELLFQLARASVDWIPAVQSLLDGNAESVTVTDAMAEQFLRIAETMIEYGSPALSARIATERVRLNLDSMAGQTMAQFQESIATSAVVSTPRSSFGRLKGRFRN